MYSLHHVRNFVVVAEELHYGRAAARLNMTQPPLSRQIQALEHELGVELFDRSGRGITLTPAGRSFLHDARRLLRSADIATYNARATASGRRGTLNVGFTAASLHGGLDRVLTIGARTAPEVTILLHELVSSEQLDRLSVAGLDLGIMRPPVAVPGLDSLTLMREDLIAALPRHHPLARRERVSLPQLHEQDMVMYSPGQSRYFFEMLVGLFADAGCLPHYVQSLSQVHSILALVNLGWGAALVPSSARAHRFEHVVYRQLDGVPARIVRTELVWKADTDNAAVLPLVERLRASRGHTEEEGHTHAVHASDDAN